MYRKIINKVNYLIDLIFLKYEKKVLIDQVLNNKSRKNIYLFSNPIHSNLGDQAQTYCILKWLKNNYNEYNIVCVPMEIASKKTLDIIKNNLKPEDLLFIHSGYLLFDPHPHLSFICDIVKLFNNRRIVILPQTVNLTETTTIELVKKSFNNHSNLILLARDQISFENAENLFPNTKIFLWPDFVTSLIGHIKYINKRDGILFCLRNDGEKLYSNGELNKLKQKFSGFRSTFYDTTINKNSYSWKYKRRQLIDNVLSLFAGYQLVITDRYHGTIFSQITSTPVIVLASSDHKLESGVKWFPKDYFEKNVYFANNLIEAHEIGIEILKRKGEIIYNSAYFSDEYFLKLKLILNDYIF